MVCQVVVYVFRAKPQHRVYQRLLQDFNPMILPITRTWTWDYHPKSEAVLKHIEQLDRDEIICVLDAFDVLAVNTTLQAITDRYLQVFGGDGVVFNAERNCFPDKTLIDKYPAGKSAWRYLNAGAYIGRAGQIKNMLRHALPLMKGNMDQQAFSRMYVDGFPAMKLDDGCELFQSTYQTPEGVITYQDGIVTNTETGTHPIVIHGNGKADLSMFFP